MTDEPIQVKPIEPNRVLETLGKLESKFDFDECLPILEGQKLNADELRAVIDAKFTGDREQMGKAFLKYGERLASPYVREMVALADRTDFAGPINSYAHLSSPIGLLAGARGYNLPSEPIPQVVQRDIPKKPEPKRGFFEKLFKIQ
jgi:hypothetical protein